MKVCRDCKLNLADDKFYTDHRNNDGLKPYCKQCFLGRDKLTKFRYKEKIKIYWSEQRYVREAHLLMFINKMYTGMNGRFSQMKKYKDLPICTRKEFVRFALTNWKLKYLYADWVYNGRPQILRPTPDRIINEKGYAIDNIQFLTFIENTKKR